MNACFSWNKSCRTSEIQNEWLVKSAMTAFACCLFQCGCRLESSQSKVNTVGGVISFILKRKKNSEKQFFIEKKRGSGSHVEFLIERKNLCLTARPQRGESRAEDTWRTDAREKKKGGGYPEWGCPLRCVPPLVGCWGWERSQTPLRASLPNLEKEPCSIRYWSS